MPVISPRRSSTSNSGSLYGTSSSTTGSTGSSTAGAYSSASSYLNRTGSLSKNTTPSSSLWSTSSSSSSSGTSKYTPSYYSSYLGSNTSSYSPRTASQRNSLSSLYLSGGSSGLGTYRSSSSYLPSGSNDTITSSRYGLPKSPKISDTLRKRKDRDTNSSHDSNDVNGRDGAKKPPSGSDVGGKRLSGSYSSSSLARLVATSGLEIYEKYSPANYKPNCELSRSSSALTESEVAAAASDTGSGTQTTTTDDTPTTNITLDRPRSRYSRLYSTDDETTTTNSNKNSSNRKTDNDKSVVASKPHRSSYRERAAAAAKQQANALTSSSSATSVLSHSNSSGDVPTATFTLRSNRTPKATTISVKPPPEDTDALTNGESGGKSSKSNTYINDIDSGLKELKLSTSGSGSGLYRDSSSGSITTTITLPLQSKKLSTSNSSGQLSALITSNSGSDLKRNHSANNLETSDNGAAATYELKPNNAVAGGGEVCASTTLKMVDTPITAKKQKCGDHAAVLVQQQQKQPKQTDCNLNSNNNAHKTAATATATATAEPKTAAAKTIKTTTNTSVVNGKSEATRRSPTAVGRRAASASSTRNTKAANNSSNTTNNNKSDSNNETNPVRAANKPFFLLPQFQDQNFLKEECELAHAQVAAPCTQKRQQQKSAGVSINKRLSELNNNNSNPTNRKSSSNVRRNSCDDGKGNNNSNSNSLSSHSYAIKGIIGGNRRSTTAPHTSAAAVAAVTTNGMRRSGGGSANASVNISQHQHHHHQHISSASVSAAAAAATATSTTTASVASTQNGASAKSATLDSTVHKVDIVFNNRLPSQTNGGRFVVTSKSPKQPQQHMFSTSRPLTGTTINATTIVSTPTSASVSGIASASTVVTTKVTNGPIKLVRPLVHRSIPSTAVSAANATATRDNVNAYSNKLFNSYGSNSSRLSTNNNNNNNNSAGPAGHVISGSGSSNNNIASINTGGSGGASTNGVNGMQHTLDHDDIKYIDSDDAPATLAHASTAAAAAATTTSTSGGGAQLERRTQLRCEQVCCRHTNSATPASAGGGSSGSGSTLLKTRMRPKSTIICSTSNLVFEKINNYKYANGSTGGGSSAAKFVAEAAAARRHELRHSIDSNSIRASIEKFDSFSEQKRSGGAQVAMRSHVGSGSTSNLQHHRHSGSEFDHATGSVGLLRLAQSGGGSLTRAPYRTASPSPASACKVTATMHGTTLAACSTGSSSSSIRTMTSSSGASSTNSLPTKSAGSVVTASTTVAAVAANRHQEVSLLRTSERAAPTGLLQNKDVAVVASKQLETKMINGDVKKCANAETNGVCNGAAGDVDSIRSTALRSIPPAPPSPTASRYWDRDSRTTTTSSLLSSSPSSAANNIDDVSKSKLNDENSEGLCGLRNIGNTCFMNSVIQCLSHTSELTKFLRTYNGTRSTSSKDQQILQEFAKLIREMWTSNVHSVTPMDLKRAFSLKHRMYSDYNQQDAQEFLRFFLDSLHCALNTGVKGEHLKIDDNLSDNKKADLTWEWYSRHENSLIRDLFVGQLKSTLRCTTCGNTSVTFDPFWDLSVSLPSSSRCKLESCLDLFIREEVLDGDEMPTCAKCRQRRRCTKSFTIQRFPKYLVIHLKRFSETRWSKLSNIVEFPTGERELNMGPYGSNPNTSIYYSLYAISNHMGSTAGGHYVALCKHPVSRKWHEFNDNIVSDTLSESNLVSSSAYILFYERA